MKRRNFIKRTSALSALMVTVPGLTAKNWDSLEQAPKKDSIITLIVDTANINQNNKDQMTEIRDNRGGRSISGDHRNFMTPIDTDKWVIWDGQVRVPSGNEGDQVNIIRIYKKQSSSTNKSLLKKDQYTGVTQVRAKAKKRYEEGEEAYNIVFQVVRNGNATTYEIDPKLKLNP